MTEEHMIPGGGGALYINTRQMTTTRRDDADELPFQELNDTFLTGKLMKLY